VTNQIQPLPQVKDAVHWYHHLVATFLRGLSAVNIGPLGGENSISAVIEAILAAKKGEAVNFELSKSEQFFLKQFTKTEPPDEVIENREINHEVQREILRRWGDHRLGVIWLGAGVFTLEHPLLSEHKQNDWHVWTDASPW